MKIERQNESFKTHTEPKTYYYTSFSFTKNEMELTNANGIIIRQVPIIH